MIWRGNGRRRIRRRKIDDNKEVRVFEFLDAIITHQSFVKITRSELNKLEVEKNRFSSLKSES